MSDHNVLPLAPRDLLILVVLAESPSHGYGIIKSVEAQSSSGVLLDPANLYRVLRRMKGEGWIEEAGPDEAGRRKTYGITEAGRRVLHREVRRLETLLASARPAMAK